MNWIIIAGVIVGFALFSICLRSYLRVRERMSWNR